MKSPDKRPRARSTPSFVLPVQQKMDGRHLAPSGKSYESSTCHLMYKISYMD
jgi:hypothetical protein